MVHEPMAGAVTILPLCVVGCRLYLATDHGALRVVARAIPSRRGAGR